MSVNTKQLAEQAAQTNDPKMVAFFSAMQKMLSDTGGNDYDTVVESSDSEKRIIIPSSMTKLTAAEELQRQYNAEEQVMNFSKDFDQWDWKDVLIAIKKCSEEQFGWLNARKLSFFGPSPREIDVKVDVVAGRSITEKAFFGDFTSAAWEEARINVRIDGENAYINVEAKRKYARQVTRFFDSIERWLQEKSIYRGKAVVVEVGTNPEGEDIINFDIIENRGGVGIVLNESQELVVQRFIINALGDRGKKTILFKGDYGTAKTETAMRIGLEACLKHGMPFFYVKDSSIFERFLNLSKMYQPALVFLEDVDEITSGGGRDNRMNSILNTIDGVQTKGHSITTIFTTNHAARISPALRRPGRIDLIVDFEYPDKVAQKKIYKLLLKNLPGSDILDYDRIVESTPAVQGAVIAQICKRSAKLVEDGGRLVTDDVIAAITSIRSQVEFMKEPVDQTDKDKALLDGLAKRLDPKVKLPA
jgi:ATPases of the AAA+ class